VAGRTAPTGKLEEMVRRIVEVADPERIILFGSAATGKMGSDSDIDLLVANPVRTAGSWRKGSMRASLGWAVRWM